MWPKVKRSMDSQSTLLEPSTNAPIVITAKAASSMALLSDLSKELVELTLRRKLMERLRDSGVGTYRIECQVLNIHEEDKEGKKRYKKNKKIKNLEFLRNHRDQKQVKEILELKMKHLKGLENKKRREYERNRRKIKAEFQKDGKINKFKRIIKRIAKTVS